MLYAFLANACADDAGVVAKGSLSTRRSNALALIVSRALGGRCQTCFGFGSSMYACCPRFEAVVDVLRFNGTYVAASRMLQFLMWTILRVCMFVLVNGVLQTDSTLKCLSIDGLAHCMRMRGVAHSDPNLVVVRRRRAGSVSR